MDQNMCFNAPYGNPDRNRMREQNGEREIKGKERSP